MCQRLSMSLLTFTGKKKKKKKAVLKHKAIMKITLKDVSCNVLCFWFSQKVTKMPKSNNILKTVYL